MADGYGGKECVCPYHETQELRLVSEVERVDGKGKTTRITKHRCQVSGCGYTYTHSEKESEE